MNPTEENICCHQSKKGGWFARIVRSCTRWAWKDHVRSPINRMFERGLIDSYTLHEAHAYATRLMFGTPVPSANAARALNVAAASLGMAAIIFTGCASFTAWTANPNTAKAIASGVDALTAYLSGNTPAAVVDGLSGGAYLVRSLESTPAAGNPAAASSAVTSAGGSPQAAAIVSRVVAQALAGGAKPDAANEAAATAIDRATAQFFP